MDNAIKKKSKNLNNLLNFSEKIESSEKLCDWP